MLRLNKKTLGNKIQKIIVAYLLALGAYHIIAL